MTAEEIREYNDLTEQQTYLLNQRIANYENNLKFYNKELANAEKLTAKLLALKEDTDKDINKTAIAHDINKTKRSKQMKRK